MYVASMAQALRQQVLLLFNDAHAGAMTALGGELFL
jgi:hypothetical protein